MLALYAIVRTDLGPDVIVETYTTAEGARLFMERQEGGPFRIAVLSERKTAKAPKLNLGKPVWLATIGDSTKAGV